MKTNQVTSPFAVMLLAVVAFALSQSKVFAQGARVILTLHNQQKISGRLLAVRDSALVIATKETRDDHIDAQTAGISVIKKQDIQLVIIKGKSKALQGIVMGAGLGLVLGTGAGVLMGLDAAGDGDYRALGAVLYGTVGAGIGTGVGLLIGGFAGAVASKADKEIDSLIDPDFSALKPFAQFPEEEPQFLGAIK